MFSAVPAAPAFEMPSVAVTFRLPPTSARTRVDRRWPGVARRLAALRAQGRRSVRIVDVACGAGELLRAARTARALGFLAIEGRGVDGDVRLIARARCAARTATDPAIGLSFEAGDPDQALQEEADFPADVVLYRSAGEERLALLARQAGRATFSAADAELAA